MRSNLPSAGAVSRRHFLRGAAGVTLGLPWLESLAAAPSRPARRLAFFYVPNGVVRRGFFPGEADAAVPAFSNGKTAVNVDAPVPPGLHPLRELTPSLEPLTPVRDRVTFVTGMDRFYKHGSDVHAQCGSCFLSSASAREETGSVYPLARTLDHVVADEIGTTTPLRTLELSCNSYTDARESIYFDNISWYGPGHVAPSIRDPRQAYDRLFGTDNRQALRDVTDLVLADAKDLQRRLGREDRAKFAEFFESIRAIEERLAKRDRMRIDLGEVDVKEPAADRLPRGEYIALMGDLMIAALQTGLTNVATLMVGPERWDTPAVYEGLFDEPRSHHQMSHDQHQCTPQLLALDRFHVEHFTRLVQRMAAVREPDGSSLLDNTLFTFGGGLGDGATHQYTRLPIVVAGSGGGRLVTGRHLHCPDGTPLANLWLTMARTLGVDIDRYADSTGVVDSLFA